MKNIHLKFFYEIEDKTSIKIQGNSKFKQFTKT